MNTTRMLRGAGPLLAAALLTALALPALAQDFRGPGPGRAPFGPGFMSAPSAASLLVMPEVQQELRLTDEQKSRAGELADEFQQRVRSAREGFDPAFGARPLKRVIQRELGDRLAMALLEGRYADGDTITVDEQAGDLTLT